MKIPPNIYNTIERLKKDCKSNDNDIKKYSILFTCGYINGLHDAGIITYIEKKRLFIYITI